MTDQFKTDFLLTANESVFSLLRDRIAHYSKSTDLSVDEYLNGGFLDGARVLTEYDKDFIYDVGSRIERVKLGFALLAITPMNQRMEESDLILGREIRSGYRRISDEPYALETVRNHQIDAAGLAEGFHFNSPHQAQIVYACRWHDSHEMGAGDHTPTCPITPKEKKHLEHLSTTLMCEAAKYGNQSYKRLQYALDLYDEKIGGMEGLRCHIKEMDELQMAEKVSDIARRAPDKDREHARSIEEGMFLPYIEERLRSDRAKYYLEYHMENKNTARDMYVLRAEALDYAVAKAPKMEYPPVPSEHVSYQLLPTNFG